MTGLRGRGLVAVASLLVTGLLVATLGPTPSAQAVINPGSIAGTVTNTEGDPLPGITVSVHRYDQVVEVETDAVGMFRIDNLAADSFGYYVRFTDPNAEYATEWYDNQISDNLTPVPVTPFATTLGVDATLEPAATITGRLTTVTGAAVTGGRVALWLSWHGGWLGLATVYETDQTGHYTIGRLKAATYLVEFYDPATGIQEFWNDSPSMTGAKALVVASGDVLTADAVLGGNVENVAAPSISGTAQVGQPLTASAGTWTPTGIAVTYRWVVGADSVPGDDPTGPVYVPTQADVGQTIRVYATGTATGWVSVSAWSSPTAPVATPPPPPQPPRVTNVVRPRVKGLLEVGEVVRVSKGVWTPAAVTFKYQWYAGGKAITDASHRRLTLTARYVGKQLTVRVKAKAAGHERAIVWTRPTARIKP